MIYRTNFIASTKYLLQYSHFRKFSSKASGAHIPTLITRHGPELAQKLDSGKLKISPNDLAEAAKACVEMKEYKSIIQLCDYLGPGHRYMTGNVALAGVFAHSGLKQPNRARSILKRLSAEKSIPPRTALTALITAHCYADKLQSAENLLISWLRDILTKQSTQEKAGEDTDTAQAGDRSGMTGGDTTFAEDITSLIEILRGHNRDSLTFEVSSKDDGLLLANVTATDEAVLPGMRVWHAMLYLYTCRESWSRCMGILRFIEKQQARRARTGSNGSGGVAYPLRLDNMVYHRAISALVPSRGFDTILSLMDEMHSKHRLTPHPRSTAQLLNILSLWDEVEHSDVLLSLCNNALEMIVRLHYMTDERFAEVQGTNGLAQQQDAYLLDKDDENPARNDADSSQARNSTQQRRQQPHENVDVMSNNSMDGDDGVSPTTSGSWSVTDDPAYFPFLDSGRVDRQKTIEELICTIMKAMGPDRGFNVFAEGLEDHLRKHNVPIRHSALLLRLEGLCRANKWKEGLVLYQKLKDGGADVKGNGAYDHITDAMIRDEAKAALAEFLVEQNPI